jgi:hypothetical protein
LAKPPFLSRIELGEPLYVYLASTTTTVSSVLIQEDRKVQKLVYYTSRVLQGAKTRYPGIEKLAFALITSAKWLRPYYQAHHIKVLTSHPLKKFLYKPNTSGHLVQWLVKLGEFNIEYLPRTAIKAQAVADFLGQFIEDIEETNEDESEPIWFIEVDGSSSSERSGVGIIIKTLDRISI